MKILKWWDWPKQKIDFINENVNIKIENNKNKIAMSDNSEIQIEKIDFINGNKTVKQESDG